LANDIAVDAEGNAYVVGYTTAFTSSSNFPGAGPPPFPPGADVLPFDGFVSKLNASGSAIVYSTYFATTSDDFIEDIDVDALGNAWVGGLSGPGVDPFFPLDLGSFVWQLDTNGESVYTNPLPPVADIAVQGSDSVYVIGTVTNSPENFPWPLITPGAFQTEIRGTADAYIVKLGAGVTVTTVSAADYQGRELAVDSIVSSFAPNIAEGITEADRIPLPTELDGIQIRVTDSTLNESLAGLIVVTPEQINWVLPPQVSEGPARVTVTREDVEAFSGVVTVRAIAPALFSANATGQGVAAALSLRVFPDGTESQELVFEPNTGTAVPIDLGPEGGEVYLLLFGTGIRAFSSGVGATVGGEEVPVLGAVAQGEFEGLDQVNIGPLPRTLAGRGEVPIELTVDGLPANTLTVTVQ
jgi:uncharacterized protein (TIGR03437 family)